MLVNKSLPNLFNGVSQQPATLRLPSQAEEQENAISSVANGMSKRNPTSVLTTMDRGTATSLPKRAYFKEIVRSSYERFIMSVEHDAVANKPIVRLYDIETGEVEMPTITSAASQYLQTTNPRDSLVSITVADYTFILNKSVTVAMTSEIAGGSLKGSKQRFGDLPTSGQVDGDVWEIIGVEASLYDNYYVKWVAAKGVWAECLKPNLTSTINPATMPVALRPKVSGGYEIDVIQWVKRLAGDDISAALPSFVGGQIKDIFFYRDRLGFTSDENIILSRSGDYFNFFNTTARAQVDNDPIDVAVSHTKNASINFAVPYNSVLLLFSDGVQFQLTSQSVLTPKTANVTQTTEYETRGTVRPVSAGNSLYFAVDRQPWTSIKEYYVEDITDQNKALDTTAHCPQYIPQGVLHLGSTTADGIVTVMSEAAPSNLYVYKFYEDAEGTKLQSAWSVWKFGSGNILYHTIIGNKLYLVINRGGVYNLETLSLAYGGTEADLPFTVCLDRKEQRVGQYDVLTNKTTWNLSSPFYDGIQVVRSGDYPNLAGVAVPVTQVNETTVEAVGNFSTGVCYIGEPYKWRYVFSQQFYKTENSAHLGAKLKLRNYKVAYQHTAYFKAAVKPIGREEYSYTFVPDTLAGIQYGTPSIAEGIFTFPVFSGADNVSVELHSDSYLPVTIHSAEWEGYLQPRGRRI